MCPKTVVCPLNPPPPPRAQYLLLHLLFCCVTMTISIIAWRSFTVHTLLVGAMCSASVWHGANFYFGAAHAACGLLRSAAPPTDCAVFHARVHAFSARLCQTHAPQPPAHRTAPPPSREPELFSRRYMAELAERDAKHAARSGRSKQGGGKAGPAAAAASKAS